MTDRRTLEREPEERRARGRAARTSAPRSSHARWEAAPDRRNPVSRLAEQAADRVPDLVPIRHGRMAVSPFTFYRGAAAIMAADLATTPDSGITVQLCGDAHLSNFGVFASPERQLIFDINDFDETLPGPWEWDVKRLATSFEVAGRDRGFSAQDRRDVVMAGVAAYRRTMRRAARRGALDAWYDHIKAEQIIEWTQQRVDEERLSKREAREAVKDVAKARTRDSTRVFTRLATDVDGQLQFEPDPPLIVPLTDLLPPGTARDDIQAWMQTLVDDYRDTLTRRRHPLEEYRYVDTARKVVGVGSVGTRAWVFLFVGRDESDPLVLQAKEATASVLEPYVGRSEYPHHGQRVVVGQRLMQAASDIFLGWVRIDDADGRSRDYYVRQLHDWKGAANVDTLRVPGALLYSELCGSTLARAHARCSDRIAIAGYLGNSDAFDRALASFATAYADQNERDYEAFCAAVDSGALPAQRGL